MLFLVLVNNNNNKMYSKDFLFKDLSMILLNSLFCCADSFVRSFVQSLFVGRQHCARRFDRGNISRKKKIFFFAGACFRAVTSVGFGRVFFFPPPLGRTKYKARFRTKA